MTLNPQSPQHHRHGHPPFDQLPPRHHSSAHSLSTCSLAGSKVTPLRVISVPTRFTTSPSGALHRPAADGSHSCLSPHLHHGPQSLYQRGPRGSPSLGRQPTPEHRGGRARAEWCTVQSRSRPRAHPPPWASSPDRCRGAPRCARPCSTVPRFPTASLLLKNGQKKSKKFKFLYCFLIFFLAPHRPTSGPVLVDVRA